MTNEDVARVCHEANRAYCETIGDRSQVPWDEAPGWQRESALNGVEFHVAGVVTGPADSHQNWLEHKRMDGWIWGPRKDSVLKTHPCMVQFHDLPAEQQVKDKLFVAIVRVLTDT